MKYIIDGYNLIPKITQLQGKRLRNQREGLIRLLEIAQRSNQRLKDLTVIFDGKIHVSAPRMNSTIKVIFSKGKNADKEIKEIVENSNSARDIAVVSDDREIRFYTGAYGAKKISVPEFLQILNSSKKIDTFKLDQAEAKKINQELEKIWLERKDR